jgi:acyl-CoA reductase-like NAD-dependent aldehyde dehydrogenase
MGGGSDGLQRSLFFTKCVYTEYRNEHLNCYALIEKAQGAFVEWRKIPAPKRGEIVRQLAERIRFYKEPLGKLVSHFLSFFI